MRRLLLSLLLCAIPRPVVAQAVTKVTLDLGVGGGALSEVHDRALSWSTIAYLGLAVRSFDPHYVGIGAGLFTSFDDWSGFAAELDVGLGDSKASGTTFLTPYMGLRVGKASGTFWREKYTDLYGGTYEVGNELSGIPMSLVLGYSVLGLAGFDVSAAPGVLWVREQDPEVPEAEVGSVLLMLELRATFSLGFPVS